MISPHWLLVWSLIPLPHPLLLGLLPLMLKPWPLLCPLLPSCLLPLALPVLLPSLLAPPPHPLPPLLLLPALLPQLPVALIAHNLVCLLVRQKQPLVASGLPSRRLDRTAADLRLSEPLPPSPHRLQHGSRAFSSAAPLLVNVSGQQCKLNHSLQHWLRGFRGI